LGVMGLNWSWVFPDMKSEEKIEDSTPLGEDSVAGCEIADELVVGLAGAATFVAEESEEISAELAAAY